MTAMVPIYSYLKKYESNLNVRNISYNIFIQLPRQEFVVSRILESDEFCGGLLQYGGCLQFLLIENILY